jgi:2-C-methyl-D-erythritol 4-phosphate cytidylyltransferase
MIYAGILAAGLGTRMHRQDMPKPFLPLGEKPIAIHTLEQFFVNPRIDKVIVVVSESWKQFAEDSIARYDAMGTDTIVIAGGENKTLSVKGIVDYIAATWGVSGEDILLTHDAIRPFVTQRMIDGNIETAAKYGAASTVMTTNDTIVASNDSATLSEVPPKQRMFAEQTPQTYKLKTLNAVFKEAEARGVSLGAETELARLYIQQGHTMRFVAGEYSNLKIVNPYDLEVANALLKERGGA